MPSYVSLLDQCATVVERKQMLCQWLYDRMATLPRVRDAAKATGRLIDLLNESTLLSLLHDGERLQGAAVRAEMLGWKGALVDDDMAATAVVSTLSPEAPVFEPVLLSVQEDCPLLTEPVGESSGQQQSRSDPFLADQIASAVIGPLRQELLNLLCALACRTAHVGPARTGGRQRRTERIRKRNARDLGCRHHAFAGEQQSMSRFVEAMGAIGVIVSSDESDDYTADESDYYTADES